VSKSTKGVTLPLAKSAASTTKTSAGLDGGRTTSGFFSPLLWASCGCAFLVGDAIALSFASKTENVALEYNGAF